MKLVIPAMFVLSDAEFFHKRCNTTVAHVVCEKLRPGRSHIGYLVLDVFGSILITCIVLLSIFRPKLMEPSFRICGIT